MAQTDSQNRHLPGKVLYHLNRHAGFFRSAWPGGYNYSFRFQLLDLGYRYLVVPEYLNVFSQFAKVLDQVVGKRIIVVDH